MLHGGHEKCCDTSKRVRIREAITSCLFVLYSFLRVGYDSACPASSAASSSEELRAPRQTVSDLSIFSSRGTHGAAHVRTWHSAVPFHRTARMMTPVLLLLAFSSCLPASSCHGACGGNACTVLLAQPLSPQLGQGRNLLTLHKHTQCSNRGQVVAAAPQPAALTGRPARELWPMDMTSLHTTPHPAARQSMIKSM